MSEPLISVIIPAWNREEYLGEAIQSVLDQNYQPIEIIVVDDGSTDSTGEVARAFGEPVRLFKQEQQGIGAARNRGLSEATGQLIAFLDSDDHWTAGSLKVRLEALSKHPEIEMVFGHLKEFHDPPRPGDSALQPYPGWMATTLLCDRSVFDRAGLFETGLKVGEFISWCARARDLGLRSLMLPDLVGDRRVHGSNTVSNRPQEFDGYLHVVTAALARRRARSGDK